MISPSFTKTYNFDNVVEKENFILVSVSSSTCYPSLVFYISLILNEKSLSAMPMLLLMVFTVP